MTYKLPTSTDAGTQKVSLFASVAKFSPLIADEKSGLILALVAVLINSGLTIAAPLMIGHAIDTYVITGQYRGVLVYAGWLIAVFLGMFVSGYLQTKIMGNVGQHILFKLRGRLFERIQGLPIAFFNENKAGDLISRINNDTDKLNQFFSRSLVQFIGNIFVIIGAGVAMLVVNPRLGLASLVPAIVLVVIIRFTSAWIKRTNLKSLRTLGNLSAEVQESLENFRVIVAFNRRDYLRERFTTVNNSNYRAAVLAGIANNTYMPVFGFASNVATLIVVTYGLSLVTSGNLTFGILISYLAYVTRFYDPLRQMASIWSDFQTALAGWERINEILSLRSNLELAPKPDVVKRHHLLEFDGVGFGYTDKVQVLHDTSFTLEAGKTYALIGPTGGGKSTTAGLMARLYDPTVGTVWFGGVDMRSVTPEERAAKIGFILQDPFLFTGTVQENIVYGNADLEKLTAKRLEKLLAQEGLGSLLGRFENGLQTAVSSSGTTISLGQKQLIAFMRALLRHPELLILDEATANIDTITEQLLDGVLANIPGHTTVVIIAHRLNTIAQAGEILFVNAGAITRAGSLKHALAMLENNARAS